MKFRWVFLLIFILAVSLPACQSATPTATTYPAPAMETQPEVVNQPGSTSVLYPDMQDGQRILWSQVEAMALNGEISKFVMNTDMDITATLKDGRAFAATLPSADYLITFLQTCGDVCKGIELVSP